MDEVSWRERIFENLLLNAKEYIYVNENNLHLI